MTKKTAARILAIAMALFVGMSFSMANPEPSSAASKPAKPTITGAKAVSTGSIQITWSKVKGAKGYQLYRGKKAIKRTTALKYTDQGLKAGTKYTYKVRAYKTYRQKQWYNKKTKKWVTKKPKKKYRGKTRTVTKYLYGKFSAAKSATTPKPAPAVDPLAVTNLKAAADHVSVTLTWTKAQGAALYRVCVNGEEAGTTETCKYTVSDLTPNTTYTFTVTAENGTKTGTAAELKKSTAPIPAPTGIKATVDGNNVTLTWNAVKSASGYTAMLDEPRTKINCTETSCTFENVDTSVVLTFYVGAKVNGKLGANTGKYILKPWPPAPANIKVSNITANTAVLSWNPVDGADSYQIVAGQNLYELGANGDRIARKGDVIATTSSTSYMVTNLHDVSEHPDPYKFYVVAGKNGNYGEYDELNATSFKTKENTPIFTEVTNISLTYGNTKIYLGKKWNSTTLSALKGASNGYEVVKRTGQGFNPNTDYRGNYPGDEYVHMFDINDYDKFLVVYVADNKITGWATNGPVFGSYYGKEIRWGDSVQGLSDSFDGIFKTPTDELSVLRHYFPDLDYGTSAYSGDTIIGGFRYKAEPLVFYNGEDEKRIGFHFTNAFRVAGGSAPVVYDADFDGGNRTWSGTYRVNNGEHSFTNTRYGAQAAAETMYASKKLTHDTENCTSGPLAGQTLSDRSYNVEAVTGIKYRGEVCCNGVTGEDYVRYYIGSSKHLYYILDPGATVVGLGYKYRYQVSLFGGGTTNVRIVY